MNKKTKKPLQWPIYIINSVDKTKLSCNTSSLTQYHSFIYEKLTLSIHQILVETNLKVKLVKKCLNFFFCLISYLLGLSAMPSNIQRRED